jgi:2-dehydro-3-deoxygalactonokinase
MTAAPVIVAIDWGTTRMRAWLLDAEGAALAEHRGDEGLTTAQTVGFAPVLERCLAALRAPDGVPVIICGMAGSRQGWIEAPYVDVPSSIAAILRGRSALLMRDAISALCLASPSAVPKLRT